MHSTVVAPLYRRLATGLFLLAIASLSCAAAQQTPSEIRIAGLKGPTSIGMLELIHDAPVLDGTATKFEIVTTPDLMVSRILSGSTDVAFLPINLAANLYAKGVPIVLAATTGDGVIYLVTSLPGITTIRDLAGRKVYNAERGSTPEFVLDYLLERNGIDPVNGLTVDYSFSHIELAQQIAAGRIDTAVLPEPFATMAMAQNPKLHIAIDLQKAWEQAVGSSSPYPTSAMVVRRSVAEQHPALVSALLGAERQSIDWVNANPQEAGALAEKYIGLPAAIVARAMPRLNLRFVSAQASKTEVDRFLRILSSFSPASVGGKLPDAHFYLGS